MSWPQWMLSVVIICICLFLMLVILLQRGRGGGIAGAFGGGGGSGAFGAKTGDVFTWITCVVAGIFVVLAVVANFVFDKSQLPTIETPVLAAETEEPPKLIPVQINEEGTALPITIEQPLTGGNETGDNKGVQSITIKPSDLAPGAAPIVLPPGKDAADEPVGQETPPAEEPPAEKPEEEPATP